MGAYNNTYIGVYIEIPHYKKENRRNVIRNPQTRKVMKTRFNPQTGVEGIDDVIVENVWISPNGYLDEPWVKENGFSEDEFFSPAYTGRHNCTTLLSDGEFRVGGSDNLFNCDIQKVDASNLIEDFKVKYKLYLDYYSDFKFDKLKVCFGVVNYAH
mgnify:CR=1 FL=1|tara:strand:+ start:64992 stop:65459 length:468 start_codon:yes stop_codon:yes gene_type:complete